MGLCGMCGVCLQTSSARSRGGGRGCRCSCGSSRGDPGGGVWDGAGSGSIIGGSVSTSAGRVSSRRLCSRTLRWGAAQLTPPVIVVKRIGGHSDYVTDFPQIEVRAIGATRPASMALQLACQRVIENSFATEVTLGDNSVVLIDGASTLTSGHMEPYENVDVREVAAVYEFRMRRPVVPAH